MDYNIIKEIDLDFYNRKNIFVEAKQYDVNSRYILVSCHNQGSTCILDKNIHTASVRYKKSDESVVFNSCEITDDGKILIKLTQQMLSSPGNCIADIMVFSAGEEPCSESTMKFYVNVIPNPYPNEEIESSNEFGALEDLMNKALADYEYVMENAQKSADDAANSAAESHSSAILAESYAHGGTGTRDGEDNDNAKKYKELAESYAEDALNSKNIATEKAEEASNSADSAKESENKSAEYESTTLQYKNEAENARDNAKESEEKALEYKESAELSAQESADSASASKQSEINSKNSETESAKYAKNASDSADQACQHEQNALQSEQNSKVSELNSAESELNALQYATEAKGYKNDAALSASSAKESKEASALSAEQAKQFALSASDNASKAESSSLEAESWTHGDTGIREGENTDNSKYYSEQSKLCAEQAKFEAENAQKYAKVTAPDFFIDTDNMTLYIKVGMIIDFIIDENNVMYWSIL